MKSRSRRNRIPQCGTSIWEGRAHPSADTFDPTTLGNSIGHWSGDTLIVDTVGFNDAGLNAIPGGGVRNGNSHLIEQYKLTDEGRNLQVTFTWIDDKMFAKPHTYAFMYEKLPSVDHRSRMALRPDGRCASTVSDRSAAASEQAHAKEILDESTKVHAGISRFGGSRLGQIASSQTTASLPFKLSIMASTLGPRLKPDVMIGMIADAGYEGVELNGEYQDWSEDEIRQFNQLKRTRGITCDCIVDRPGPEEQASSEPRIRRQARPFSKKSPRCSPLRRN